MLDLGNVYAPKFEWDGSLLLVRWDNFMNPDKCYVGSMLVVMLDVVCTVYTNFRAFYILSDIYRCLGLRFGVISMREYDDWKTIFVAFTGYDR